MNAGSRPNETSSTASPSCSSSAKPTGVPRSHADPALQLRAREVLVPAAPAPAEPVHPMPVAARRPRTARARAPGTAAPPAAPRATDRDRAPAPAAPGPSSGGTTSLPRRMAQRHATDGARAADYTGHCDPPSLVDSAAVRARRAAWPARIRVRGDGCAGQHDPRRPRRRGRPPPYAVALSGTDAGSGLDKMQWKLDGAGPTERRRRRDRHDQRLRRAHLRDACRRPRRQLLAAGVSRRSASTVNLPADSTDSGTAARGTGRHQRRGPGSDPTSGLDHVEWQLDGGSVHIETNGTNVPIAGDGAHVFRTRAVDVAGNPSAWTDHRSASTPSRRPTHRRTAGWRTGPLHVSVVGSDAHSGIATLTWQLDGGAINTRPRPPHRDRVRRR